MSEWGSRAGMARTSTGSEGNAILPPKDTTDSGVSKVDRTTVTDLADIAAAYAQIETQMQNADKGLNPLGLAKDVTPFDIDPAKIDAGETHFEQIYDRAQVALSNAVTTFNNANGCTQLLRQQADSLAAFQQTIANQEADFNSRLIESFGYPYAEDIGPTGTYPTGYNGPDLYHYMIMDPNQVDNSVDTQTYTVNLIMSQEYIDSNGGSGIRRRLA